MDVEKLAKRYRVTDGKGFRLADHDPADTGGLDLGKKEAQGLLQEGVERLAELQDKLYAQDRWAVLLIFQAMDAAGKDGAIKHVMSGVNPQGCQVYSFKQPSAEELDHDFLWRYVAPPAGARADRHLQPLLLRGSAGRARPPGASCERQKLPPALVTQGHLEGALRATSRPSSATWRGRGR